MRILSARSLRLPLAAALGFCGAMAAGQSAEQESDSKYRETYAIVGARIEIGDGRVVPKGTVLVRDGRIAEVGPSVRVPGYAYVIPGDGLVVYPGFIDAYSTKGLKLPDPRPNQDAKVDTGVTSPSGMRVGNRKGTRPELQAADHLDLQSAFLIEERKSGIAHSVVAPTGGMLNGVAALVAMSGRPSLEAVVLPSVGVSLGFSNGGSEGYPSVPLGIMAHLRQVLLDAQGAREGSGPLSLGDRTLAALQPALRGQMPVLMEADRGFEITRALGLADQFGLRPIVVGGQEAWKEADELKRRGVPVIVSLGFAPEPMPARRDPSKRTQSQDKPEANPAEAPRAESKKTDDPVDVPSAAMQERQVKWLERVSNAKALAAKGVPFAFTSRGDKSRQEFWKNLRRAISAGLPREVALRALTSDAARILGVSNQLGTVEPGKAASLVVMSRDFAEEDSKVRYMILDRWLYRPDEDKPPTSPPAPRSSADEEPHGDDEPHGVGR